MNHTEIHDKVLNAANTDELMDAYRLWSNQYDDDLLQNLDYVAPKITTTLLQSYLANKDAYILDVGCGTGIVGNYLHQDGYHNLEGMDYSQHMLNKAKEKAVYRSLKQCDLTKPLAMAEATYDVIISVGTFTCGHIGPEVCHELVRITKAGGLICFTVREQAWEEDNYRQHLYEMERNGLWTLQEFRSADYLKGARCKICLYQVGA